ncbi:hypothetical protein NJA98_003260 [Salmonella enterica]|nr:hypothetical protein [Salmonella enterica subsp. enterica serovar Give]EEG7218697.1 hypothetical protein [Salmonella enterica]EGN9674142.1 hypothetical protein [Salmonella enterica subsp. enterica serovar Uganda]EHS7107269.1 hypothetical protein [Salmonella enterica subsp. enterica serovar Anatum var. 15+]EDG9739492.1 hypothetical protein [Salmonella enterica subsp. enterica serovar Give]
MGSNIIELAKLGHERAAELKASCGAVDVRSLAQLISDLATQLEVQFVRSTNMAVQLANAESKCRELAGELSAVDKIHNEAVFITDNHYEQCPPEVQKMIRSLAVLQIPAYDAFLAEVRASELDSLAGVAETMLVKFSNRSCSSDMHEVVGWKMLLQQATNRAAKLRKGAAL